MDFWKAAQIGKAVAGAARARDCGACLALPEFRPSAKTSISSRISFAMDSEGGDEGLDLFQEPADFYQPEKQATSASHQLLSGKDLTVRLVGHNPLWVRLHSPVEIPGQSKSLCSPRVATREPLGKFSAFPASLTAAATPRCFQNGH